MIINGPMSKSRRNAWYDLVLKLEETHKDRWHIKHKKGNSSKVWRYLQSEIKHIAKYRLLGSANKYLFEIEFLKNRAIIKSYRFNSTKFVSVMFSTLPEVDKIIQDLSPVLAHYKLELVKTCENNRKGSLHEQWAVRIIQENFQESKETY